MASMSPWLSAQKRPPWTSQGATRRHIRLGTPQRKKIKKIDGPDPTHSKRVMYMYSFKRKNPRLYHMIYKTQPPPLPAVSYLLYPRCLLPPPLPAADDFFQWLLCQRGARAVDKIYSRRRVRDDEPNSDEEMDEESVPIDDEEVEDDFGAPSTSRESGGSKGGGNDDGDELLLDDYV